MLVQGCKLWFCRVDKPEDRALGLATIADAILNMRDVLGQ